MLTRLLYTAPTTPTVSQLNLTCYSWDWLYCQRNEGLIVRYLQVIVAATPHLVGWNMQLKAPACQNEPFNHLPQIPQQL